ncbi:MAG: malate dehydrogenase, partial [Chloroflexi bacterium]|nr:malate dehydrogenase [Chloroflexota bacterium]
DVRARTITDEMCLAAAEAIAALGVERGLDEEHLVPDMQDAEVFPREATAVGMKAQEQGLAGIAISQEALYAQAAATIRAAREMIHTLMAEGAIRPVPEP